MDNSIILLKVLEIIFFLVGGLLLDWIFGILQYTLFFYDKQGFHLDQQIKNKWKIHTRCY